jgi:hypothetical protein
MIFFILYDKRMGRHTRKAKCRISEFDKLILERMLHSEPPLFTQVGGVHKEGIVSANGFRYKYIQIHDVDAYKFLGGPRPGKKECFLLFVNKNHTAELHSARFDRDCSIDDGGIASATAHNLVHAAFALAKEKGAIRIELNDGANKYLPNGKHFRLSDMYFLATGQTWYEHVAPSIRPVPTDDVTVQRWRQKVLTNRWNDVSACMMAAFPTMVIPVDTVDIDGAVAGSAMTVFRRIKEARTDFFADYRNDLLVCSGIGPIERITWFAEL